MSLTSAPDFPALDGTALGLLSAVVAQIGNDSLDAATPCAGWTVLDLVRHLNTEHEEIAHYILGTRWPFEDDPLVDSPVFAARWSQAMATAGPDVYLPRMGIRVATDRVRSVHFVDMLVHRWDLTRALGFTAEIPPEIVAPAVQVARAVTAPGSFLVGSAYQPARPFAAGLDPADTLAALLGRDPSWRQSGRGGPV